MIAGILPPGVAVGEAFGDLPEEALFPQEEAAIARAVGKRRAEFRTVRGCARAALAQLGVPRPPLVPGTRGAPAWPAGIVGSMTHCDGYRAAAVTWSRQLAALGVDAEPDAPLPDGVLGTIALPAERQQLTRLAGSHPQVSWDRLLFSAKESVYKAWYPMTGQWLGFEQAELAIDPAAGTFAVRLLVPWPGPGPAQGPFAGRWAAGRGLVLTAVTVPAPDTAAPLVPRG